MQEKFRTFDPETIEKYVCHLKEQERAENTTQKYQHDLHVLYQWLAGRDLGKEMLIEWKKYLTGNYAVSSVNSMLAAVNGFLHFMEWQDWAVKPLKVQRSLFSDAHKEFGFAGFLHCFIIGSDHFKFLPSGGFEELRPAVKAVCPIFFGGEPCLS